MNSSHFNTNLHSSLYLVRAALKRGPRFLWMYFREAILFDLVHGTNTHFRKPKDPAESRAARSREYSDGLLYVASLTSTTRETLRCAESLLRPAFEEHQFVDLGSGKGKALLVYCNDYSKRALKRAIGIEYDEELCAIARKNLAKMNVGPDVAAVVCDTAVNVLEHCHQDTPLLVYLYNAFQGRTLREVLQKLSLVQHLLIYVDPAERDILAEFGYEILRYVQGRYNATTWLVAAPRRHAST